MDDERLLGRDDDLLGEVLRRLAEVDRRGAVVVEDPERVAEPQVDARRLDQALVPRVDPDSPVGDELEDRPVGENGGRGVRHRGASVPVRAAVVPRQLLLWPPVPP